LISVFWWWRNSGESYNHGIAKEFHKFSFEEFLLQKAAIQNISRLTSIPHEVITNPIGYWTDHVSGYLNAGIYIIRYEDVVLRPVRVIDTIQDEFGLKLIHSEPHQIRRFVGHYPNKVDVEARYRMYSSKLLDRVYHETNNLMLKLGYPENEWMEWNKYGGLL
jgi:hypothetical protein